MPRPRKDGSLQLALPLMTAAEKVEQRAYYEAKSGQPLGRWRRRRQQLGQHDKPRGKIAEATTLGRKKATQVTNGPVSE